MSIQELLPVVRTLTDKDKRRLHDWLEKDLYGTGRDVENILPPGMYFLQSPAPSYEAAGQLTRFLETERAKIAT